MMGPSRGHIQPSLDSQQRDLRWLSSRVCQIITAILTTHISLIDDKGFLFEEDNVRDIFRGGGNITWQGDNSCSQFVMGDDLKTLQALIDQKVWHCTPYSYVRDLTRRPAEAIETVISLYWNDSTTWAKRPTNGWPQGHSSGPRE